MEEGEAQGPGSYLPALWRDGGCFFVWGCRRVTEAHPSPFSPLLLLPLLLLLLLPWPLSDHCYCECRPQSSRAEGGSLCGGLGLSAADTKEAELHI